MVPPKPTATRKAAKTLSQGLEPGEQLVHLTPAEIRMLERAGLRPNVDTARGVLRIEDPQGYGADDDDGHEGDSMGMGSNGTPLSSVVANAGRNGDTLAAVTGRRGRALMKNAGGSGSINPRTGLKEFFVLDDQGSNSDGGGNEPVGNGSGKLEPTAPPVFDTGSTNAPPPAATPTPATPPSVSVPNLSGSSLTTPTTPTTPTPPAATTTPTAAELPTPIQPVPNPTPTTAPNGATPTPAQPAAPKTRTIADLSANEYSNFKDSVSRAYQSELGRNPEANANYDAQINRYLSTPGAGDPYSTFQSWFDASPEGQQHFAATHPQAPNSVNSNGGGLSAADLQHLYQVFQASQSGHAPNQVSQGSSPLAAVGSFSPQRASRLRSSRWGESQPFVNVQG